MKTVLKDNVFCAELQNSRFFFQPKQRLSYKVIHSHSLSNLNLEGCFIESHLELRIYFSLLILLFCFSFYQIIQLVVNF